MDKKATGILSYITIIGWLVAYCAGDKEGAKVHLNQGLVLGIASLIGGVISWVPILGWIASWIIQIAVFVFAIIGIIYAAQDMDKELPLIGSIKLLK